MVWVKSTYSTPDGDNCVEVSPQGREGLLVRSTRDRLGPVIRYTWDEWTAFVAGVRNGEFDQARLLDHSV